ncbi:BRCA1-associated RING domain protein 1 [Podila clonocystis]|nr:BRCA1-associated RING domain protein 1 [Podila clonocystis]
MQSQQEQVEILPDYIDGILRRMEEELKCAIWQIYEHEYGHEKSDGPSTDTTSSKPTAKIPVTETITTTNTQEPECQDTDEELTQVCERSPPYEQNTRPHGEEDDTNSGHGIDFDMDLACFDVDLDTVSEEQGATLALQMLRAMSIVDTAADQREPTIKTEDEDLHIDHTHSEPIEPETPTAIEAKPKLASSEDTFILTTTNLEINQKAVVEKVAKALKEKFVDELSSMPTHVVVKNVSKDDSPGSGRTVKLLMGIISAAWILQFDWVSDSMEAGYWVQEDDYELPDNEYGNSGQRRARSKKLQGEPPLFHGYEFQLFGTIQNLSKGDLDQLISAGGGVLVPELFRHDMKSRSRLPELAPQHHVLLFDPSNQGIVRLRKLRTEVASLQETAAQFGKHLRVVKSQTLLDTIYQYNIDKLLDTDISTE